MTFKQEGGVPQQSSKKNKEKPSGKQEEGHKVVHHVQQEHMEASKTKL